MYNKRIAFQQTPKLNYFDIFNDKLKPITLNSVEFDLNITEEDDQNIKSLRKKMNEHMYTCYNRPERVLLSFDVYKSIIRYHSDLTGGCVIPSEFEGITITLLPNLDYHDFIMYIEKEDIMKQFTNLLFKEVEVKKNV
jgi:hypothetical protein